MAEPLLTILFYSIFRMVSHSSSTALSASPFLISSTTQDLTWLDSRVLLNPFNADWIADTWTRISVQYR